MQTQSVRPTPSRPTKNGQPVRGWRSIPSQGTFVAVTSIQYVNGIHRRSTVITTPNDNLLLDVKTEVQQTDLQRWVNSHRTDIALEVGQNAVRHQPWVVQNVFPPDEENPHWTYHLIPLIYSCIDSSLWALPREGLFVGDVPLLHMKWEGKLGQWLKITVAYDEDRPCPPLEAWLPWLKAHLQVSPDRWEVTPSGEQPGSITFDCKHFSQCTADGNPVVSYERSYPDRQIIHTVSRNMATRMRQSRARN